MIVTLLEGLGNVVVKSPLVAASEEESHQTIDTKGSHRACMVSKTAGKSSLTQCIAGFCDTLHSGPEVLFMFSVRYGDEHTGVC